MKKKKSLKPRDRFSYGGGYGYVINENQAIVMEPKRGHYLKYVYVSDIPVDARFTATCPTVFNAVMDALDLIKDLSVYQEELIVNKEIAEAS